MTPSKPTKTQSSSTDISTYTPVQNVTNPARKSNTVKRLDQHDEEIGRQKIVMNWILGLTIGISLVCFIAFITFIIDAWRYHAEKYQENIRVIEELKEENQGLREQSLTDKINNVQKLIDILNENQATQSAIPSN